MIRIKKRLLFAVIFLLIPISVVIVSNITGGKSAGNRIDANRSSPFIGVYSTESTPINFQLGGYEYSIPANYFDFQADPRCNDSSLLLAVLLPDLQPKTKDNGNAFRAGKDNSRMMILANVNSLPWEERLKVAYHAHTRQWSSVIYELAGSKYGLLHKVPIPEKRSHGLEVYEHLIDGQRQSFIVCDVDVPYPGCDHFLFEYDLIIKLNYRIRFLPEWKQIEEKTRKLIRSFNVGLVKEKKPSCQN